MLFQQAESFESRLGSTPDRIRYYYLARNAIWHGMPLLGLRPGDEILMPIYHHGVEVDTMIHLGYRMAYYRIDEHMRIDLEHLHRVATAASRALYVIHYLGMPQPMEDLRQFARDRGLRLIEDCALALFSRDGGELLGGTGDLSIYCLYKTLPVPHGGVLRVNDPSLAVPPPSTAPGALSTAAYLAHRTLEGYELEWSPWGGDRIIAALRGIARRLKGAARTEVIPVDTPQFKVEDADLGIAPICRRILDRVNPQAIVTRRRDNFRTLAEQLDPGVRAVWRELPEGMCPLSFPIRVENKPLTQERLLDAGVQTVNFWFTVHPAAPHDGFPEALALRRHVLELPVHQGLHAGHMRFVADQANQLARW